MADGSKLSAGPDAAQQIPLGYSSCIDLPKDPLAPTSNFRSGEVTARQMLEMTFASYAIILVL